MKMLQKTAQIATAFLGLTFFSACESVVEVPIPGHTPKLAVIYMLGDQKPDSLVYQLFPQYQPYVNQSQEIYSGTELKGINHATLTLKDKNGNVVETYKRGNGSGIGAYDDGYYEPVTRLKAQPGQTYSLEVAANGFETVTGQLTMPSAISGVQAAFVKTSEEGDPFSKFKIVRGRVSVTIPDYGAENNYYLMYGSLLDNRYVANARDAFQEEPEDEGPINSDFQNIHFSPIHYGDSNPFDDKTFNGKTITVTREVMLYIGNSDTPPRYLRVYVHSITEGAYKFQKSLRMYNETGDNPFAEQTRVLGNLENGYGYFGGYTSTHHDIVLNF